MVFNFLSCVSFIMWFDEHLQSVPTWYDLSLIPWNFFLNPNSSPDFCKTFWSSVSPSTRKDVFLFPFVCGCQIPLEWHFQSWMDLLRNSCRGVCTVTVMVIRLLFHLESNIMMTLKLDMKHICKKEVRRGAIWAWVGSLGGRRGALCRCREDGRKLRVSLRRGSRCRAQTAPQWLAWFCCRSPLVSHPVQ